MSEVCKEHPVVIRGYANTIHDVDGLIMRDAARRMRPAGYVVHRGARASCAYA